MGKKGHGHHGGAWKVAYADFVTAMMALFLVLWLTKQDEKIKEAVERAFRQPFAIGKEGSSSMVPKDGKDVQSGTRGEASHQESSPVELAILRKLSSDLLKSLKPEDEQEEDSTVDLKLSPDGLRISIFDRGRKPVFEKDTVQLTPYGKWVFSTLAWEIARYTSFQVELEGHTEKGAMSATEDGGWDLSSGRANTARKKLLQNGVQAAAVRKVAGYADTLPLPDQEPSSEMNRRVTVMLRIKSAKSGSS